MSNKLFFTRKMIGKRVAVIEDYEKFIFWCGTVDGVKDQDTLLVKNENDEKKEVSIFDVRNPSQEII
ncbi:MAG: hypothetical protein EBU90_13735 [Proteobacteria bacterium]|nr:hypothetical protein [Pseudomonadota bacterium]